MPAAVLLVLMACWLPAWGFAHAALGDLIENSELPTLDGGRHTLLTNAAANVFIFFKPGQEHSRTALSQLADCAGDMATQSVHWVAIVSDRFPKAEVEALVKETGLTMPVLLDVGDALYGKLGVALTPVTGITGQDRKLVAYEPFTKVNYREVIRARLRHLLKEITDQELAQVLDPVAATQGGNAEIARRRLKMADQLFQAKDYAKAIASVNKSIEKDPAVAAAHALLGQILAAQGNHAEAVKAFEQALKLDPGNAIALEGRKVSQEEIKRRGAGLPQPGPSRGGWQLAPGATSGGNSGRARCASWTSRASRFPRPK